MSKPERYTFDDPTGYQGADFDYYDAADMDRWLAEEVLPVLEDLHDAVLLGAAVRDRDNHIANLIQQIAEDTHE